MAGFWLSRNSWEWTNHPNWRTPWFFRGVGIPPTSQLLLELDWNPPELGWASGFTYYFQPTTYMGMDQHLLIPFLGGWTSIYQLFWCSPGVQGFDTLPHLKVIWAESGDWRQPKKMTRGRGSRFWREDTARNVGVSARSPDVSWPWFSRDGFRRSWWI